MEREGKGGRERERGGKRKSEGERGRESAATKKVTFMLFGVTQCLPGNNRNS